MGIIVPRLTVQSPSRKRSLPVNYSTPDRSKEIVIISHYIIVFFLFYSGIKIIYKGISTLKTQKLVILQPKFYHC